MLQHRAMEAGDLRLIRPIPENEEGAYYCSPGADEPLIPEQLQAALDKRSDSSAFLLEKTRGRFLSRGKGVQHHRQRGSGSRTPGAGLRRFW